MAALEDTNPYELRPQPRQHAEPGHVHSWWLGKFRREMRCTECGVMETTMLRAKVAELEATKRRYENGIRKIMDTPPRTNGARTGGFGEIHRICEQLLPISEMADDDR